MSALLQTFHDSLLGGHSKYLRTYKRMARELFSKGVKEDLKICGRMCSLSKKQDRSRVPTGLLQPLPIQRVWDNIIMDFVERLPKSKGYQSVIRICRICLSLQLTPKRVLRKQGNSGKHKMNGSLNGPKCRKQKPLRKTNTQ